MIKAKTLIADNTIHVVCEDNEPSHVLTVNYYNWDDDAFFDFCVQLPRPGFLRRCWWAQKYIFRRDGLLWGDWQSTMMTIPTALSLCDWIIDVAKKDKDSGE